MNYVAPEIKQQRRSLAIKKYYTEHREVCLERSRKYYEEHKEELQAKAKLRYAEKKKLSSQPKTDT